jgi:hypothetical protein
MTGPNVVNQVLTAATCSLCNYDRHDCPGCGAPTGHVKDNQREVCAECKEQLRRGVAASELDLPAPDSRGALNIDACRVGTGDTLNGSSRQHNIRGGNYASATESPHGVADGFAQHDSGRWPSNVVLTHADCADGCDESCPIADLDGQSGTSTSGAGPTHRGSDKFRDSYGEFKGQAECAALRSHDTGGASRFFPVFRWEAKAPTSERPRVDGNAHPTVKPLDLMRWMVRLVTPPGGIVLDLFAGTGTTGHAARAEGMRAILIEQDADHVPLIVSRLDGYRAPALIDEETGEAEPMDLLDLLGGEAS